MYAHSFYSRSRSSRAEKPCCGDDFSATQPCGGAVSPCATPRVRVVKKNAYQSGSIARYCDALMAGVEGNPQMIQDMIRDLQCVIEKTCGSSKDIEAKYQSLLAQLAKLKEELCQCQLCRAELEKEICRLQGELQAAQFAFEEEAQRRMCLEQIVSQLRGKLGRMETLAEKHEKENQQLAACLKQMQAKIDKLNDQIAALEAERDELLQNCRGLEQWNTRQNDSSASSQARLAQLEEALAKCCTANEELQNEIRRLREELECLRARVEQLQCEMKQMAEEFARERDSWAKERCRLQQINEEMKKTIDCLTQNNIDGCRRMKEVVSAHHVEMDCLRKEAEKYKMLYECEKEQRGKLERALRDCEERKKQLLQQMQQQSRAVQHQQLQQQQQQPCSPARLNPCSDILERLNSDRGEYTNDLKSRLGNANEKIAGLEKDLQHVQARNHEKDSALDRSTRDVDQCKSMQKSLEVQLDQTRDEVNQTRTMCEALRATNTQLQIQLSQNENERAKPHEAEKLARLQDENRNLLHTVEEERAAKELFRRELKDSQRLWETEVKAKGILADRITRQERMQIQNESNNNEESSGTAVVKLRETLRLLKTEVRMERDQVTKLKAKIEEQREQLRSARDTLQEVSNDSKSRKLTIELDQLKHEHHNFVTSVNRDREVSRAEISRLEQAKAELERELKDVQKELRENELNREAIQEVMRRKDRLDTEVEQLKRTINERYVERTEVAEWHANYETRIASLRTQYEAAVEAQVKAKLLEMQLALDRQARDRALIDKMRDSNEDVIRHEQSQMSVTLKTDIEKLKHTVRAREEEISSLKSSILHLKKKYSSEANMKDELLKKLQIMSAVSRPSLPTIVSNNNI